jgi:AcrR family transcriptional regulator
LQSIHATNILSFIQISNSLFAHIFSTLQFFPIGFNMATKKPISPLNTERREPTQERALRTIDTIFVATAQIVEEEGASALNTNKIAARAGFSVGTLYQYFPSKEAILLAMIERQRGRVLERLSVALSNAEHSAQDPRRLMAEIIHILVQTFGSGRKSESASPAQSMRGEMIRLAWQMDHHDRITHAMREAVDRIALYLSRLGAQHPQVRLRSSPAAMFVVVRAVMGTIRSASLERSALLGTPEFEGELVRLAWGLLVEA